MKDFNILRAEEAAENSDEPDDNVQEMDVSLQEEMDIVTRELMETEAELEAMEKYEQCGITCDKTTRLPCVAHKVIIFSLKNHYI